MPTFIKPGFWEKKAKGYIEWLNLDQLIESKITPPTAPYKVYTALLTQNGGDDWQDISSGLLTTGVTYFIDDPGQVGVADFTNVGAPNNNAGTYFVATGTTPNNWGDANLRYNTGAPVVTVLENTIGNIWFEYEYPGYYFVKSDGLFTPNKTALLIGGCTYSSYMDTTVGYGPYPQSFSYPNTLSIVSVKTQGDEKVDDVLIETPIEIRVYN